MERVELEKWLDVVWVRDSWLERSAVEALKTPVFSIGVRVPVALLVLLLSSDSTVEEDWWKWNS